MLCDQIGPEIWFLWQQLAHIGLNLPGKNGGDGVSKFSWLVLIRSLLILAGKKGNALI